MIIVVAAPTIEFLPRIGNVKEDLAVQAFIPQPSIKAFDVTCGFRGM
jgi:hypothetical protein